ncbi:hypothetical protein ACLOJK_010686 [Asimina triloba]
MGESWPLWLGPEGGTWPLARTWKAADPIAALSCNAVADLESQTPSIVSVADAGPVLAAAIPTTRKISRIVRLERNAGVGEKEAMASDARWHSAADRAEPCGSANRVGNDFDFIQGLELLAATCMTKLPCCPYLYSLVVSRPPESLVHCSIFRIGCNSSRISLG